MRIKKEILVSLVLVGGPILLGFISAAVERWHFVFDDAFITYRYAKNLASGAGITWNPGETPTEGYTNFLLVVILAPFIKLGADPLLVTRILSWLSAAGIAAVLFYAARRRYQTSIPAAIMVAAAVLLSPPLRQICMAGLETVIYAFSLLVTFHLAVTFVESPTVKHSVRLSAGLLATILLRPEAALLYPLVVGFVFVENRNRSASVRKPLWVGALVLLCCGGGYLVWKAVHFGALLPNPFYLKASGGDLLNKNGVNSVLTFVQTNGAPLAVFVGSLILFARRRNGKSNMRDAAVWLGALAVAAVTIFFLRTNTLMDFQGRFMFPLLPITVYAGMPALAAVMGAVEARIESRWYLYSMLAVSFLLAFGPRDITRLDKHIKTIAEGDRRRTSNALMQREQRIAETLATYPGIETVRIACGDAGVMPYLSNAKWLDIVGLNDSVISRTRDFRKLVDYVFEQKPDLVIKGGSKDYTWPAYGHGPLGRSDRWMTDIRWDGFAYVGTVKTHAKNYDLQFLVRKKSPHYKKITRFLRHRVIDGAYRPFPYPLGGKKVSKKRQKKWLPRAALLRKLKAESERKARAKRERQQKDQAAREKPAGRWSEGRDAPWEAAQMAQLKALGYVDGSKPASGDGGVSRHTDAAFDGFNFYVSGHAPEAVLMDMTGEIHHRWRFPFKKAWPRYPHEVDNDMHTAFWRRAHLFKNGDVIAIFEGLGMIKINKKSQLIWKSARREHHDLQVMENGDIYVITRERHVVESVNPTAPIVEDFITQLNADGEVKRRVSLVDCFQNSRFMGLWDRKAFNQGDIFHTNAVHVLTRSVAGAPAFEAGRVLTSFRTLGVVALLDLDAQTIVWAERGTFEAQHDPRILDNGHLMVFDNKGGEPENGGSRILEYRLPKMTLAWQYEGSPKAPFFSLTCGIADRLPNGNTLVTETDNGRAFEITPDGHIVWEFLSPHRAGPDHSLVASLFALERLPASNVPWLK